MMRQIRPFKPTCYLPQKQYTRAADTAIEELGG
jgi:hypothetical protein